MMGILDTLTIGQEVALRHLIEVGSVLVGRYDNSAQFWDFWALQKAGLCYVVDVGDDYYKFQVNDMSWIAFYGKQEK
jgi:hypothetical protein